MFAENVTKCPLMLSMQMARLALSLKTEEAIVNARVLHIKLNK